jgi:hypothetical protein
LRLDTLEHIDIDVINQGCAISFKLTSVDYITKRQSFKIVETMDLPGEYKYMNYQPVIKKDYR